MQTKQNREIKPEITAHIYREAKILAKNNEDVAHDLFLKGVEALDRFNPEWKASVKTYVSKVMAKSVLSMKRRHATIAQREAYDIDLTLFVAPARPSVVTREFEDEELKELFRFLMKRLSETERKIVLAMLKARTRQDHARSLLAAQGLKYSVGSFCTKVLPALKAKMKELMAYDAR